MKITRRNRPVQITDAPEHRNIPLERVELRDDADDENEIVLEGYASTFEEYDMYGGPSAFGWIERIDPSAFEKTLREKPDLHLLINHAGTPLARTKSGTLDLRADDTGLKVVARLDKRDPEVQSLAVKMERGDMDEMSFAFRVKAQEWRAAEGFEDIDEQSYRTITEVSLHKGDVSVVNWGANSTTSAGIRSASDALKVLAECDESELAEIRSDDALKGVLERLAAGKTEVHIENVNIEANKAESATEERTCTCQSEGTDEITDEVTEEEVERETEEVPEVTADETAEETEEIETEESLSAEKAPTGMRLADALAFQGIMSDAETLSLEAALALA